MSLACEESGYMRLSGSLNKTCRRRDYAPGNHDPGDLFSGAPAFRAISTLGVLDAKAT
jgi:hypothetical protein